MAQKIMGFTIYGAIFVVAWGLLYVYQNFGYQLYEGGEMAPTVEKGAHHTVNVPRGLLGELKAGDLVIYNYYRPGFEKQTRWMGRIIAMPGQRVKAVNGETWVNGTRASDTFVSVSQKTQENLEEIMVPADCVYIMHDNRKYFSFSNTIGFQDSRNVGPIGIRAIVGIKR